MQKKFKFMNKRVLAILLAFALVLTNMATDGMYAFASSASGDASVVEEVVVDEAEEAVVEEAAAVEEVAEEVPEEEEAEEVAEEALIVSEAVEAAGEVVADASADAVVAYPAIDFGTTYVGTSAITISAPEGAFPEGTSVVITPVSAAAIVDAIDAATADEVTAEDIVAYDISFRDANGIEIEPLVAINVSIVDSAIEAGGEVLHMDDVNAEATPVAASVEDGVATFVNDEFSIYVVKGKKTSKPINGGFAYIGIESRCSGWGYTEGRTTTYYTNKIENNKDKVVDLYFITPDEKEWTKNGNAKYTTDVTPVLVNASYSDFEGAVYYKCNGGNKHLDKVVSWKIVCEGDNTTIYAYLSDHPNSVLKGERSVEYFSSNNKKNEKSADFLWIGTSEPTYTISYHNHMILDTGDVEGCAFTTETIKAGDYLTGYPYLDKMPAGYEFMGWVLTHNECRFGAGYSILIPDGAQMTQTMIDSYKNNDNVITLHAKFKKAGLTVTLNGNGGYFDEDTTKTEKTVDNIVSGTAVSNLPTPTKDGYTFAGWTKDGSDVLNTDTITSGTYVAKWTATNYTITYNGIPESVTNSNPTTYTIETATITLADPGERTGYTFTGWTVDGTGTPAKGLTIPTGSTGAKTFTAHWTANTYTVEFHKNGAVMGISNTTQSFTYDETKALTSNVYTRSGYEFLGWSTTREGSVEYTDGQSVSNLTAVNGATVHLYAVWQEKKLVVEAASINETYTGTAYSFSPVVKDQNGNVVEGVTFTYSVEATRWVGYGYGRRQETYQKTIDNSFVNACETTTVTITATKDGYTAGTRTATVTIAKAPSAFTATYLFGDVENDGALVYNKEKAVYQVAITTGDQNLGQVTATSANPSIASVSYSGNGYYGWGVGVLTITPGTVEGETTITLTLAEGTNYLGNTYTFTVKSKNGVLTVVPQNKTVTYNGRNQDITVSAAERGASTVYALLSEGQTVESLASNAWKRSATELNMRDAGTYTVAYKVSKVGYQDNKGTVTLTIQPKTVDVVWGPTEFTYNGQNQSVGAVVVGTIGYESLYLTAEEGSTFTAKDAGEYTATYNATLNAGWYTNANNYVLSENAVLSKNWKINKRPVYVEYWTSCQQKPYSWDFVYDFTYDGTDKNIDAHLGNVVWGETLEPVYGEGSVIKTKNAGEYSATVVGFAVPEGNETKADNYVFVQNQWVSATKYWSIDPKEVTISWRSNVLDENNGYLFTKVYDTQEMTVTAFVNDVVTGDEVEAIYAEDSENAATNVGTYYAVAVGLSNENYVLRGGVIEEVPMCEVETMSYGFNWPVWPWFPWGPWNPQIPEEPSYASYSVQGWEITPATLDDATVTLAGWTVGTAGNTPVAASAKYVADGGDLADVEFFYYTSATETDENGGTHTTYTQIERPTAVGTYIVVAWFPATENYFATNVYTEMEDEGYEVGENVVANTFTISNPIYYYVPTPPVTPPTTPEEPEVIPEEETPAAPVPPVVQAPAVEPEVEAEVIEEEPSAAAEAVPTEEPTETIEEEVSAADAEISSSWSLANMIAMLLAAIEAIALVVAFARKRQQKAEGEAVFTNSEILKLVSVPVALAAVIVFFVTQDLGGLRVVADSWTPCMVILAAAQTILAFFAKKTETAAETVEK